MTTASAHHRDLREMRDVIRSLRQRSRSQLVWRGASESAQWPDCLFCEQSPTGSYAGRVACLRCSSRGKLTA